MPFQSRYVTTIRGAIVITGNTLGLGKNTNGSLTPGTSDAIGAFTTINTSVPTATGWAAIANLANGENVTLDWTLNSSSAQLNILSGSTILYAELIWGGAYDLGTGSQQDVTNFINNSIRFTVPGGQSYLVAPNAVTSYTNNPYYSRSANVTSLISGSGTYTVGNVPAALSANDTTTACAGWTLIVVYSNLSLPIRNMTVFSGGELVFANSTIDTIISGFYAPLNGTVNARVCVSSLEGDSNRTGDFMQFGPTVANLTKLYGPNNWANPPNSNDNFFNSQINIGDSNNVNVGQVDRTGTFGNRNQNASVANPSNITAGRQGWSITNVNAGYAMTLGQTSAVVRLTTQGDVYLPNGFAVQIDSASTIINMQKTTTDAAIYSGDTIHYTVTVSNTGTLRADNFLVYDPAPTGTLIDVASIVVTGAAGTPVNNSTSSDLSIQIGTVNLGQTVTIKYNLLTSSGTIFPVQNVSYGQYNFTPAPGSPVLSDTVQSTTAVTNGARVTQTKSVSNSQAASGDIITYTVLIDNTASSIPITGVSVLDTLQAGTSYVANSTVIGSNPPINANPNAGITVGTISAFSSQTVKFNARVTVPPAVSPILNTANITFTAGTITRSQATNATSIGIVSPDFSVIKSVDRSIGGIGDTLTYTTVITNTGNIQLTNLIFEDAPPTGTTYNGAGVTIDGTLYPALNPNSPIDLSTAALPADAFPLQPGEFMTISYKAAITSVPSGNQISNTSTVTAQYTVGLQQRSSIKTSNAATTNVFTITLNKSVNRAFAEPGDTITYTVTITSSIPGTYSDDIVFIDNLPANTTRIPATTTVTGASVIVNNSTSTQINLNFGKTFANNPIVVTFSALVGSGASGTLQNNANVYIGAVSSTSNTVSTQIEIINVTKSASESYVTVGQIYNYTVSIDNRGNNAPLTQVYIYDALQAETTYYPSSTIIGSNPAINSDPSIAPGINIGTVAANTLVTVRFSVILNSLPVQNPILNTAAINYFLDGVAKNKITNQTQVTARIADIAINKAVSKSYADTGEVLTYTITAVNTGNVNAENVKITDIIPSGTSFNAGSITSTAAFSGTNPQTTGITFTNPIIPGATVTTSFTVTVNNSIPSPNPISNTASVNFNYTVDPAKPVVNKTNISNAVTTTINTADLTSTGNFTKSADKQYVDVGGIILYTLNIRNTGNVNANNVVITDPIPVGTTFIAGSITSTAAYTGSNPQTGITLINPIIPGGTVAITYQVRVDVIPTPNPINNDANINYTYTVDPANPNGASDSGISNIAATTVNNANIGQAGNFIKSVDKTNALIGEIVTYTLTISNTGNTSAANVVVTDTVPNGTAFNSGSITSTVPVTSTTSPSNITINLTNPIGAGSTVIITYQVTVEAIPVLNPMPNTANVNYSYTVDPVTPIVVNTNGTSNTVFTSVNQAVISGDNFTKTVDRNYADVGDTLTYVITAANSGSAAALPVVIKDVIPTGTTLDTISVSKGYTDDINTGITINGGILNGETVTITLTVIVNAIPVENPILNFASIQYTSGTLTENGNTNVVSTQINSADLLSTDNFTKEVDKAYASVGDVVTYYLSIVNTGNVAAYDVIIEDIVPTGTSFVPGSILLTNPYTNNSTNTELNITLTNPVQPNERIDITFQAHIDSIPTPNPMINTADISYRYKADPESADWINKNGPSNSASTTVNIADLTSAGNFTKTADKSYADVGDTINYTITVDNTGNVDAADIVITDVLPNGTNYVEGSISIIPAIVYSSTTTLTNVVINIPGTVAPADAVITITFSVNVATIPVPNPLQNTANINYKYTIDPAVPNGGTGSGSAGPAATQVNTANFNINKSVDKQYANVGDVLTYTIIAENTGTTNADNVVITDIITPVPGTDFLSVSAAASTGAVTFTEDHITTPGTLVITITNPASIIPGSIITITYKVTVTSIPSPKTLSNTASINYSYTVEPGNVQNGTNTSNPVTTDVNVADLTSGDNFTKTASLAYADIGDVITYTIKVKNTGSTEANSVVVRDAVPNGTTFVGGSINADVPIVATAPNTGIFIQNPVAAGSEITITFQITVTSNPSPNPISNTANVEYSYVVDPINNVTATGSGTTSPAITTVNTADLTLPGNFNKDVDKLYSDIGGVLTYTITVKNTGTTSADNVVVKDVIPAGAAFLSLNTNGKGYTGDINSGITLTDGIAVNEIVTITLEVTVTSIPPTFHVVNSASVTYDYIINPTDPLNPIVGNGSGDTNQVSTRINEADLNTNFKKSVDKAYAVLGEVLTYTITTSNIGNIQADNVIITDSIPPSTTFNTGSVTSNVSLIGTDQDPSLGIQLANPVLPTDPPIVITYKVTVTSRPIPNIIPNTADIRYDYIIDPTKNPPITNTDVGQTNEVTTEVNYADLIAPGNFEKSIDKAYADVGDILTYTINIKNTGNTTAHNVVVTDILPAGTEFVEGSITPIIGIVGTTPELGLIITNPIAAGETVTLTYKAAVVSIPPINPIQNTADIRYRFTADPAQPNGATESGTSTIAETQINNANLTAVGSFFKSVSKNYADIGEILTYTITTTNTGNTAANLVQITDEILSIGVSFIDGSILSNVTITGDNPETGINIASIDPGQTVWVSFRVSIDAIPVPNPIENTANISYKYTVIPGEVNGVDGGGTTPPVLTLVSTADLISPGNFTKTADKQYADVGDTITYTVIAENTGNTSAENVIIKDILPTGTSFVPGSITSTVPFTGGNIQNGIILSSPVIAGGSVTITYKVLVIALPTPNPIQNTADIEYRFTVDSAQPNGAGKNGTSTIAETQVNNADLISQGNFLKSVSDVYTVVGDTLTYTLTIRNTGNVSADNVKVSDIIPPGTSIVDGSITSSIGYTGTDIESGIILGGPIASGAEVTVSFQVTVNEIPDPNPIVDIANISYTYTVDPAEQNGVSKNGVSNEVLSFVICENKEVRECLSNLEEGIPIQYINAALSTVNATVIKQYLDKSHKIYKNYNSPAGLVSGYNLYLDINLNYKIIYNNFKLAEFNRINRISIFIPLGMSNENLLSSIKINSKEFFIDGARRCFLIITKLLVCAYIN